jgi:hypothetical protein
MRLVKPLTSITGLHPSIGQAKDVFAFWQRPQLFFKA